MGDVEEKGQTLAELEGFNDIMEMLEEYGNESVMPGICMNEGCDYITNVEPDQDRGWCEECHTNSVKSLMELALS